MRSVVFVINRALVRDPRGFDRRCRAAARNFGWEPVLAETSPGESGLGLARRAVADGAGLVFAAGGDGTVRACAQALAGTGIPLAIVPLGTANLTARALGLPARADRAIEVGFRGRDRRIDLASAEVGDAGAGGRGAGEGCASEVMFAAMAGIGLDAAVVEGAHAAGKRRMGWVAYAVSGVAHLWWPAREFTVRLDGGEPLIRQARCVVVGNAGLLPGGFWLLPEARCDDGWLDVGILAPTGVLGWAHVAGLVLTRSRRADAQLARFRARRVEISTPIDLPRQIDGEVIAPGRALTVSVRPAVLTVRQRGLGGRVVEWGRGVRGQPGHGPAGMGTDRRHRVRGAACAHRPAAPAVRGQAGVAGRERVRGRDRRVQPAAGAGLDRARDLLRLAGARPARRRSRRPRLHHAGADPHPGPRGTVPGRRAAAVGPRPRRGGRCRRGRGGGAGGVVPARAELGARVRAGAGPGLAPAVGGVSAGRRGRGGDDRALAGPGPARVRRVRARAAGAALAGGCC